MDSSAPPVSAPPLVPAPLLSLGADLVSQVQQIIGTDKVRALHVKFGGRTIKEIPVGPLTMAATVVLVALAVIVSTLSIEVEHEPKPQHEPQSGEASL